MILTTEVMIGILMLQVVVFSFAYWVGYLQGIREGLMKALKIIQDL